jgi:hypothetical protein
MSDKADIVTSLCSAIRFHSRNGLVLLCHNRSKLLAAEKDSAQADVKALCRMLREVTEDGVELDSADRTTLETAEKI